VCNYHVWEYIPNLQSRCYHGQNAVADNLRDKVIISTMPGLQGEKVARFRVDGRYAKTHWF
jgi:hypothetical protein